MSNRVSIKVQVGKREYKTLVSADEVQQVQAAALRLNEKMQEYEAKYEISDIRDLLAMTALYFATETEKNQPANHLSGSDLAKLDEANHLLGKYLAAQ